MLLEWQSERGEHLSSLTDAEPANEDEKLALEFLRERFSKLQSKDMLPKALADCNECLTVVNRKIANRDRRRGFWKTNYVFETNRAAFYRRLKSEASPTISSETAENALAFWGSMWCDSDADRDTPKWLQCIPARMEKQL